MTNSQMTQETITIQRESSVTSLGLYVSSRTAIDAFNSIFSEKNLTTFLVVACKVMTFLAVVSSQLPPSDLVCPVFCLNSATILFHSGVTPLEGVTRGGLPALVVTPP